MFLNPVRKTKQSGVAEDSNPVYPQCRVMTDLLDPTGDATQSWRVFRVMAEFVEGFDLLRKYGLAVTFFGSARVKQGDPFYEATEELASRLAKSGFAIITGGGPGIMEAANVGAYKAGGKSVGFNIDLPMEQSLNSYTTDSHRFHFFFTRKVMLSFASEVYVYFPGGFGTLDELFELVTLIQTGKISKIPIVLYGKDFWSPLLSWIDTVVKDKYGAVSPEDLAIYYLVDSVDEAYDYVMSKVNLNSAKQI